MTIYGGEEGDGAIAGTKVCGLSGFEADDDNCRLPDGWNVCVSVGEVEEVGEIVC